MPHLSNHFIQFAGYGYVTSLLGALCWYAIRRSGPARIILALLIFVPALLCFCTGLSMFVMAANSQPITDAVSDPSGLVPIIAFAICGAGAVIAFFGVRVLLKRI